MIMENSAEQTTARIKNWWRADKALDKVKRQELQSLNQTNYLELIDGMLQWAVDHAEVRLTSGLVEQQRIFSRLRNVK